MSFKKHHSAVLWAWSYLTPAHGTYIFSRCSSPFFPRAERLPGCSCGALLPTTVSGISRSSTLAVDFGDVHPASSRTLADVLRGAGGSTDHRVIPPDTLSPSVCAEEFLMALLLLRQKKTISKVTEINFSNEVAWHAVKGQGAWIC